MHGKTERRRSSFRVSYRKKDGNDRRDSAEKCAYVRKHITRCPSRNQGRARNFNIKRYVNQNGSENRRNARGK